MRLWSLHPKYCWREALLAQKVLMGDTKGYRNHSQLERFKASSDPLESIGYYLVGIHQEASERGYTFNYSKINKPNTDTQMFTTTGQMMYEWMHLMYKLEVRNNKRYMINKEILAPKTHPLFQVSAGSVEDWEKISS